MIYKYQTFRKETFRFWKCLFYHVFSEYNVDTPIVQMTNHIYLISEGLYKSSMKQYLESTPLKRFIQCFKRECSPFTIKIGLKKQKKNLLNEKIISIYTT